MGNVTKKVFSTFVTLTTVLSTVGVGTLVAPGVASAATLAGGDLIKASGPAVYYYAGNGKRYVFPNEKTYFSWFADFSTVKTITDAELAAIMIGGNVTIRPGTKLVKITTDPKVYAVTAGGVLHWVESEAIAIALYGANWAQRVVDVPDGFFVNYTVGSSLASAVHPDGSLIAYAGSTDRYVVMSGTKRKVTDAGFSANFFQVANILPTTISYPNGTDVTARETALADIVTGTGGVGTPVTGGTVGVSLASDTPAGATVAKNANSVSMAKFNLTAGSGTVLVTGVKIHRVGIGAVGDFSNVYLYDGNGTRLSTGRSINSTTNVTEFNGLNLTIAAGASTALVVVGDFNSPAATGGQHAFEIADAASVVVSGSGTVSGSFPVRANVFTVGTATAATVTATIGTTPSNPTIGAADAEVSNFKLAGTTNDVEIRRVTLYQAGDINNSDLTDLKLYQGSTLVASTPALTADGHIVFNFTNPYLLATGQTKTFSMKAKVGGRAGRTIKTYIEYSTDVYAVDKMYNTGAAVDITAFDGGTSQFITVTTQGGQLTVSFNGPATANVSRGQQDVVLYKFAMSASDNQLEIRNMRFKISSSNGGKMYDGTSIYYLSDIKVKDLDTGETVAGPQTLTFSDTSYTTGTAVIANSFYVDAGKTRNLAITADTYNTDSTNFIDKLYKVTLGDVTNNYIFSSTDVRVVSTGEFLDTTTKVVPNTPIAGNEMTVVASSLTVGLASSPSSGSAVKNQKSVAAVGFSFQAGTQSDVKVTAVKLTGTGRTGAGGAYAVGNLALLASACKLYEGTTQLGTSQNPDTSAGTMTFSSLNWNIPKGTTKNLVAQCDVTSNVTSTSDAFALGILTDATDVTAEDADNNAVTATVSAAANANAGASPTVVQSLRQTGTLTVAADQHQSATILVPTAGETWYRVAKFKATAQYEGMTIDKVAVTSTGDAANFTQVGIMQNNTLLGWNVLPSGNGTTADIDLTGNVITVPKDGSVTYDLVARLATITASSSVSGATTGVARSGASIALGLAAGLQTGAWNANYASSFNIHALGAASSDLVYASGSNTSGNTFVTRKAKPVITRQALTSTTLASGTDMDLIKFQLSSSDQVNSLAVKKMTFTYSKAATTTATQSGFTLSTFRLRRGSTELTPGASTYNIYGSANANGEGAANDTLSGSATILAASTTGYIVVEFVNEEVISGSGNVYTIHATIGGSPVSGDNFNTAFTADATTVVTGYLDEKNNSDVVKNLDIATTPDGTGETAAYFLWSDQSEVPHAYATGTSSSFDWTRGTYVEDLSFQSTLSR
ncbi:MAG: hypothetical protein WCV84_02420 [Patescibacteria group bacterium]